jgi:hypothetical protein
MADKLPTQIQLDAYRAQTERLRALDVFVDNYLPWRGADESHATVDPMDGDDRAYDDLADAREVAVIAAFDAIRRLAENS